MAVSSENQEKGVSQKLREKWAPKGKSVYHAKCCSEVRGEKYSSFCIVEGIGDLSKQPQWCDEYKHEEAEEEEQQVCQRIVIGERKNIVLSWDYMEGEKMMATLCEVGFFVTKEGIANLESKE